MNPEGRYFLSSGVGYNIKYKHPNPDVDATLYDTSIEEGQESQQIEYEALSYV
jgi:hypothetical protein